MLSFGAKLESIINKGSDLEKMIEIFDEKSRNYIGVDFSSAPTGTKKILITGFDPFFLNEKHPLYGPYSNFLQSNPSGCVALSLDNTITANNLGYIKAMIIPVRYFDFDSSADRTRGQGEGIIEKYIKPWINQVDMIITISQTAPPFEYNIDKYATATRGGLIDNLGFTRNIPSFGRATSINGKPELEWLKTTLPSAFIVSPVVLNTGYTDKNGNELTDHTLPNESPKEQLREGSGGNYLSNEIFYRVAKLRSELRPSLATGHFHIKKLQSVKQDFSITQTLQLINIVKIAINYGITGL